jgi:hypothetical protein
MERRKLLLIVAVAALPVLLIVLTLAGGVTWYLRGREKAEVTPGQEMTRCDVDPSGVCVVSFAADAMDQMVINLHLPAESYPSLYAMVTSRGTSTQYPCQAVEDEPASVYCSGPRTPLGEAIDLRIVSADSDQTISQGTFIVSAIALPSPVNYTVVPEDLTQEPVETATPFVAPSPGPQPTFGLTMTPTRSATPGTQAAGQTPGSSGTPTPTGTLAFPTSTRTLYPTNTGTPLNQ